MRQCEEIQLSVYRFRDSEGNPVCSLDHANGQYCRFLGCRCFGLKRVCLVLGKNLLNGRPDGLGYTIPDPDCPVWKE